MTVKNECRAEIIMVDEIFFIVDVNFHGCAIRFYMYTKKYNIQVLHFVKKLIQKKNGVTFFSLHFCVHTQKRFGTYI